MEKDFFLKYMSPETQTFFINSQAKALLKEFLACDTEISDSELPKTSQITYNLLQSYIFFRKTSYFEYFWPIFLHIFESDALNPLEKVDEVFSYHIKAFEDLQEKIPCLKVSLDAGFGQKIEKIANEEDVLKLEVFLSCDNREQTKTKLETLLSNIKTLLKNLAKKMFLIWDLFENKVEIQEKGLLVRFLLKDQAKFKDIAVLLKTLEEKKVEFSLNFGFEIDCQNPSNFVLGAKKFENHLFLKFPKILKEALNKILYEEAEKLMKQKETFAMKFVNRISYFSLLQSGAVDLEFKSAEGLSLCLFQQKTPPFGDIFSENLQEILLEGPPFMKKFIETFSFFSGDCSIKLFSPVSGLKLEAFVHLPVTLSELFKDLLSKKLK